MFELTQTAELAHWQGELTDKSWQAFLADVRRFIQKDVAPAQKLEATVSPPSAPKGERGTRRR